MAWDEQVIGTNRLIHGNAEDVLPTLAEASVQLIVVDPPYYKVKTAYNNAPIAWDRQWKTRDAYLAWLRGLAQEWQRVLTPNGSLYCFASPQMAAWVEVMLADAFQIIQRVTWRKPPYSTKAEMFDKDTSHMFFPASEAIIFAEQYGSDRPYQDALITENASYWTACEQLKRRIFGAYLTEEFTRAGVTQRQMATLFPSATGGLTGCVSNWLLGYNCPTSEQYHQMRNVLNTRHGCHDYLRREYEDLRRPFTVSPNVPYTDVWDFATVPFAPGKHPAEKPLPLLRHIIQVSSRPGDTVLDCCAGSFATLVAAQQTGRCGIGIEQSAHWYRAGQQRLSQGELFVLPTPTPVRTYPQQLLLGA